MLFDHVINLVNQNGVVVGGISVLVVPVLGPLLDIRQIFGEVLVEPDPYRALGRETDHIVVDVEGVPGVVVLDRLEAGQGLLQHVESFQLVQLELGESLGDVLGDDPLEFISLAHKLPAFPLHLVNFDQVELLRPPELVHEQVLVPSDPAVEGHRVELSNNASVLVADDVAVAGGALPRPLARPGRLSDLQCAS